MHQILPRKHVLTLSLVAMLSLSFLLSACGDNSSAASGPVTLTYGWWSNSPTANAAMRSWLDSFTATRPNIKIQSEILPWPDYWNKVQTTTAGGTAYDIVGLCSCLTPPYFNKNVFLDLSTFSDYQSVASQLTPSAVSLYNWNGKQEGLPVGVALPYMGYNIDMLKAAGLPLPDATNPMSFADFKATYGKLTKFGANGKATQYAMDPRYWLDQDEFIAMEGGSAYDNISNPHHVNYESPVGIAGLTDYQSLFTDKLAPPLADLTNGAWGAGDLAGLLTGKIAFARIGSWNFADIASKGYHIGIAPIFKIQKAATETGANGFGIYRGTKHLKEAWEFMKWAMSSQGNAGWGKFSDIPTNTQAQQQLSSILAMPSFTPTVQAVAPTFVPTVNVLNPDYNTLVGTTVNDMLLGKLTPQQAAQKIDQQGNPLLASS